MSQSEAVESAARAIHRYDVREGLASTYAPNEHHRDQARVALEAAAPYTRGQGYEDGVQAAKDALLAFADERDNAIGAIRSPHHHLRTPQTTGG